MYRFSIAIDELVQQNLQVFNEWMLSIGKLKSLIITLVMRVYYFNWSLRISSWSNQNLPAITRKNRYTHIYCTHSNGIVFNWRIRAYLKDILQYTLLQIICSSVCIKYDCLICATLFVCLNLRKAEL